MSFLDSEKQRQAKIRRKLFSPVAQIRGRIRDTEQEYALHDSQSHENLYRDFRDTAITYFRERQIPWHMATHNEDTGESLPSNHLCSSQVMCVNTLWPFVNDPELLRKVLGIYYPEMAEALEMTADGPAMDGKLPFLSFEWIGEQNYLGEVGDRFRKGGERQRGALATSADFAFRFRRNDGRIQLVLGEWKYTESYVMKAPDENATRQRVYSEAFEKWSQVCPNLPAYEHFFVEPFYQLMRMTLLAREMEYSKAKGEGEMDADIVTVLLVAPQANQDYHSRITSAGLAGYGRTVPEVWTNIVETGRFQYIPSESLLMAISAVGDEQYVRWSEYLLTRYGWWRGGR